MIKKDTKSQVGTLNKLRTKMLKTADALEDWGRLSMPTDTHAIAIAKEIRKQYDQI